MLPPCIDLIPPPPSNSEVFPPCPQHLWETLEMACWFQCWEIQPVCFEQSNNTGAIDVKMDGSVLEEKSSFKMLGLTFSSKLDWGSYIISIAKTASKKIGALICSMKFLSSEVALYLHKSTIHPCMEYCCHLWAVAPSCYLELLGKLQKWIYRTVSPSLAASLEPFAHCRNVASLRAIVCKIQANGESDHLRIVFFFHIC